MRSVFLTLLMALPVVAQASSDQPLSQLAKAIDAKSVAKVQVLHFPARIMVGTAMTARDLDNQARYRLEIVSAQEELSASSLKGLLTTANPDSTRDSGDMRWKFAFLGNNGNEITVLYFDAFGRKALVNGKSVEFKTPHVFKALLRAVHMTQD